MKHVLVLLCIIMSTASYAQTPNNGGVVSAHPLATKAGTDILEQGGNAFDAAVAVSAALGVVEPYGSGLGGGGFWLLYQASDDTYTVIDAREIAPLAAHKDMYLDENGEVIKSASVVGARAAGIPGQAAAFATVNKEYGSLTLQQTLAPVIGLASDGFAVDERYITGVTYKKDIFNDVAASVFLDNGKIPEAGWVLKQPDLSKTLSEIANNGHDGFYDIVARDLVEKVGDAGGIWTLEDFKAYKTITRDPVIATYKDARIIMPPLPSSGGLVISNILNILSDYTLDKHVIIEAMRQAYHKRALYMGDEDFVDVPVQKIIADKQIIDPNHALVLEDLPKETREKGTETTHFSVIDKAGNRVAVTQSINFWFGSGFMPEGTGIILNNEMDDFTIKSGTANGYGLMGTSANYIEPGKRMLSSMTPTIVESPQGVMIIGTPGGSRIISMNLLAILAHLEDGKTPQEIVDMPRYHHQYMPDEVVYEDGAFTAEDIDSLTAKGHTLRMLNRRYGNMQILYWDYETGSVITASDPRGLGAGRVY